MSKKITLPLTRLSTQVELSVTDGEHPATLGKRLLETIAETRAQVTPETGPVRPARLSVVVHAMTEVPDLGRAWVETHDTRGWSGPGQRSLYPEEVVQLAETLAKSEREVPEGATEIIVDLP